MTPAFLPAPTTSNKLDALIRLLTEMRDSATTLEAQLPRAPVDQFFLNKLEEWAQKLNGVASGYYAEYLQMYKHRIEKNRFISDSSGDVTIGEPGEFGAKTVQLKATVQDHTEVNSMMKVALNQLSGERGETPRDGDRMVVDMTILSAENAWPGNLSTLGTFGWDDYVRQATSVILTLCSEGSYRKHIRQKHVKSVDGMGLNPATRGMLTDVGYNPIGIASQFSGIFGSHHNSSQMMTNPHGMHPSQGDPIVHLTFKIRYRCGYPLDYGRNILTNSINYRFLERMTFNVINRNGELQCFPVKAAFFTETGDIQKIDLMKRF